MTIVTSREAEIQFAQLLQSVSHGEEVIITENSFPIVKMISISKEEISPKRPRKFGSAKGLFIMADDFDAPLEDWKEYME